MTSRPHNEAPNPASIAFRRIDIEHDVHHLYRWLGDEDVRTWYDEGEHNIENYRERFAPESHNHKFIIEIDGAPAGYIQAYRLSDEPDYAGQIGLDHDAVSIDIMLGEATYRGKGWGSVVLHEALARIVFGEMNADHACINPDPKNERAVRSYEKAGFRGDRVVWVESELPVDTGYERIMVMSRADFEAGR